MFAAHKTWYIIITKCEVISPPLEAEINTEVKTEEVSIILKPKQEMEVKSNINMQGPGIILKAKQKVVTKSAAQIVH